MRGDIRREKEAFIQVQSFLDENPGLLAGVNATGARRALDEGVAGLTAGEEEQNSLARMSRAARVDTLATREKLLTHQIRAVVGAARLLSVEEPKLEGLAAPRRNIGTARLVGIGNKMVNDTEAFADLFATLLGEGYLDKLRTTIQAVEQTRAAGQASRAQRTAATKDVWRWLKVAQLAMATLTPLVREALENEPKLLTEWNERRKKVGSSRTAKGATVAEVAAVSIVPATQEVKAAA